MRPAFWEAVESEDGRLLVRHTGDERRGRLVRLFVFYPPAALAVVAIVASLAPDQLSVPIGGASLAAAALLLLTLALRTWRGPRWVFDRKSRSVSENGRVSFALADLTRFSIRREKPAQGGVVFLLLAQRRDGEEPILIAEMDQSDAHDVGRALARYTGLSLSER